MQAGVDALQEERGVEPLTEKAAVQVRERADDRVDPAVRDGVAQFCGVYRSLIFAFRVDVLR